MRYVLQEQQKHLETSTQLELYRSRLAAAEQQMASLQGRSQQAAAAWNLLNSVRAQVSEPASGACSEKPYSPGSLDHMLLQQAVAC